MNTDRLHEFAELELLRRDLEAQVVKTKALVEKLREPIIADMQDALIPSIPVVIEHNGVSTRVLIYVQEQLWAKAKPDTDMATLKATCEDEDLHGLVKLTAHAGSLSSYVREALAEGTLPESIANLIDTTNRITLRSRTTIEKISETGRAVRAQES